MVSELEVRSGKEYRTLLVEVLYAPPKIKHQTFSAFQDPLHPITCHRKLSNNQCGTILAGHTEGDSTAPPEASLQSVE